MEILIPIIIVAVIGLVAGVGLSLAAKFMSVPTDERQEKLRECLPGANCGACGYSGCDGYAAALAKGEATPDKCAPGGKDTARALGEILGVSVTESEPKVAFIGCGATAECAVTQYKYIGMKSCAAAAILSGGPLACEYGCIGFGDCANACPFHAISLQNGRPVIDRDLCVACGKCATVCPKHLIDLVPAKQKVLVNCSNLQKGAGVVKNCTVSCIGCGMCERACESDAIHVVNNCAVIDYEKCTGCGKCKAACKRGAIIENSCT